MPHLKKAYETYRNDPNVSFLLVSLDDDPKRLERYLEEMDFDMPVARTTREEAERLLNVTNTPTTFYVDPEGTVRYEVFGGGIRGESEERVSWFIEELKK